MNLFYSEKISKDIFFLEDQEAVHCSRVLRMNPGDAITATDGKGNLYKGKITELKKNWVAAEIVEIISEPKPKELHIAIAPTKSIDRFEWFLEKATECGVTQITPIITFHSERRKLNYNRLLRIVQSAAKQSLRTWFPVLMPISNFEDVCQEPANNNEMHAIAHCQDKVLPHLFGKLRPEMPLFLLIGPEGDFSDQEITMARKKKFVEVSLGKNRLRTETAGLIGCQIFSLKNEIE